MQKILYSVLLMLSLSCMMQAGFGRWTRRVALGAVPTALATTYLYTQQQSARSDLSKKVIIEPLDPTNKRDIEQTVALCDKHQRMLLAPNENAKDLVEEHIHFMNLLQSKDVKVRQHLKGVKAHFDLIHLQDNPEKIVGFAMFATEKNRPAATMKDYLVANKIKSDMFVFKIAVDEKYQNCGIGSLMMQKLIDQAQQEGLDAIVLEVYDENTSMLRLKDKFGFQPIYISLYPSRPFADGTRSYMKTYVKMLK